MVRVKVILFLVLSFLAKLSFSQDMKEDDATAIAEIINHPVVKVFSAPRGGYKWIIAGDRSELLYKLSSKGEVVDLKSFGEIPSEAEFTDILFIRNNRVLVGTRHHFAYLFDGKRATLIDSSYGLADSSIVGFEWSNKFKLLMVKTSNRRFLVKHHNKLMNIRFSEMKDTVTTLEEVKSFLKKNFRWRIQKGICVVAADIDFSFRADKFISNDDLKQIKDSLQSGDIIIKRNDNQLSNVGIPGFWTHSGIYVGSLSDLDSCFKGISFLGDMLPSEYLKENYHEVYEKMYGRQSLIIEGIGKGVVINPVEHIAKVDYLAALRPNLKREDVFKSLLTAFEYLDTPYDYLFDFSNDNELVCSELVYLSFKPSPNKAGITFAFGSLNGDPFLSPNDIAKQYGEELKAADQQLKLVFFYDAEKRLRKSVRRNEAAFAKSWKRNM